MQKYTKSEVNWEFLVLWLALELLKAEIDRLKGGELQLSLFVGVGLVAFFRKVLIATLSQEDVKLELVNLGGSSSSGLSTGSSPAP